MRPWDLVIILEVHLEMGAEAITVAKRMSHHQVVRQIPVMRQLKVAVQIIQELHLLITQLLITTMALLIIPQRTQQVAVLPVVEAHL